MRLLTFSSLYPNTCRPGHGIFVEARLRQLLAQGGVQAVVVSPVPWFPSSNFVFGEYALYAKVPARETRYGVLVLYPRYPHIPKLGMTLAPWLMALAMLPVLKRLAAEGHTFDLIDAHYFYPDGVAAVMVGKVLNKPVVITARGTDLNLVPQYYFPRCMIQWAAHRAAGLITVCNALKEVLTELGISKHSVAVLRNGVDLDLFRPHCDRERLRSELGFAGPTLLSVGLLIPRKGHDLSIRALRDLPAMRLLIVGEGPQERPLKALAMDCGVADRVSFVGSMPQERLRDYYAAADALILASSREGWANVLLEAMACGTPVVATRIWGTPEVVAAPEAGILVDERTPAALACAVRQLLATTADRAATRRYAEGFSWDATSTGLRELFARVLARSA